MGMASKPLSLPGASLLSPVLTVCSVSPDGSFSSAGLSFSCSSAACGVCAALFPRAVSNASVQKPSAFPLELKVCPY